MTDPAVLPGASAVRLFVGGDPARIGGEPVALHGDRCFTAAAGRVRQRLDPARVTALLDSGAFSDTPARRLDPERTLERQLRWEAAAGAYWGPGGATWHAHGLVSYDRMIDEKWYGARRVKERWTVGEADAAVAETVAAARYLATQRPRLAPRRLVLACQGVDAGQYRECVAEVARVAGPADWIGLGGWCVLGRWQRRWVPPFWQTLRAVLPVISGAGVRHVHVFGVLYLPALGGLLWLADRHGLTVSTDSSAPLVAATRADPKKAGMRAVTWRGNVGWWRATLAGLRGSVHYRRPPGAGETWVQPSIFSQLTRPSELTEAAGHDPKVARASLGRGRCTLGAAMIEPKRSSSPRDGDSPPDSEQRRADGLIARWLRPDADGPGPATYRVAGRGVQLWALAGYLEEAADGSPAHRDAVLRLATAEYHLPVEALEAALAFYRRHRAAIDAIAEANRPPETVADAAGVAQGRRPSGPTTV